MNEHQRKLQKCCVNQRYITVKLTKVQNKPNNSQKGVFNNKFRFAFLHIAECFI